MPGTAGKGIDPTGNDQSGTSQGSGGPLDVNPRPDKVPLPRVRNVRLFGVDSSTKSWAIEWRDLLDPTPIGLNWFVSYTPDALAGFPVNQIGYASRMFNAGRIIGSVRGAGTQDLLQFAQSGTLLTDGYIQIAGKFDGGQMGQPCSPQRLGFTVPSSTLANDVTNQAILAYRVVAPDGTDDMLLWITFLPPSNTTLYGGVEIHLSGMDGDASLREVGSLLAYNPASRNLGTNAAPYRIVLPQEKAPLWQGTVTMTSGSANIVRVTGPNFTAPLVGRRANVGQFILPATDPAIILVSGAGADKDTIASFTDANHIAMTGTFGYSTGTYSLIINNALTFYFVSVNTSGFRTTTPLTEPSVAL